MAVPCSKARVCPADSLYSQSCHLGEMGTTLAKRQNGAAGLWCSRWDLNCALRLPTGRAEKWDTVHSMGSRLTSGWLAYFFPLGGLSKTGTFPAMQQDWLTLPGQEISSSPRAASQTRGSAGNVQPVLPEPRHVPSYTMALGFANSRSMCAVFLPGKNMKGYFKTEFVF